MSESEKRNVAAIGNRRRHAMTEIFGIPTQALFGQLLIGLINGSFYAMLSLGLAVIFGLLNIINFTHGAQYMLGAFCAYCPAREIAGVGYWWSLLIAPLVVGITGVSHRAHDAIAPVQARPPVRLLLTFGLALIFQGVFTNYYGSSGPALSVARRIRGRLQSRLHVSAEVSCVGDRCVGHRVPARPGSSSSAPSSASYLRAATENPTMVQAFGINVPRMITLTYGFGVALAAFAGVMAAPIYQVSPLMGANLIIVVFAVVVIGGMGSILGAVITGFGLGDRRGADQGLLPGSIEHRHIRDHGDRTHHSARGSLR